MALGGTLGTSIADRPSISLGPLGVIPACQRRGVGRALMHAVLAAADALDEPAVTLLGDPAYYSRSGSWREQRWGYFRQSRSGVGIFRCAH
ncbi:MAG: GNAT family N-acetyltransferase [Pseudonocardiaceae bacterium]